MATANGNITVFESSDGGTGDPRQTFWQFFVGAQAVTTKNALMAETARLAIETPAEVRVTYDPGTGTISQIRMEFAYVCEAQQIRLCTGTPELGQQKTICDTRRYSDCAPVQPAAVAK